MTQAHSRHRYTFRDYINLELQSTVRHEFWAGEIYAMTGGTPQHAALAMAIGASLLSALRGTECRVHSSDLRVRVAATGLTTYPDVTVVCAEYESDPADKHTIVNPTVLVEVTSDSTEEHDRTVKLEQFQLIPSIQAIVLVSHSEALIDLHERTDAGQWQRREARGGETIDLPVGGALDVDPIYADAGV